MAFLSNGFPNNLLSKTLNPSISFRDGQRGVIALHRLNQDLPIHEDLPLFDPYSF
jgi:hypothetical protein